MIRRAFTLASCLALGCAQSIPGVDPPGDEVYFPLGITVIPDASGQPAHLAVLSSNFDQRYNSGTVTTYRMDQMFALANCASGLSGVPEPEPCIRDSGAERLRVAQSDTVRVFSFGGDLLYVPGLSATQGHLFVASRGRNRITMINVDTGAGKLLTCSTGSLERVLGSDCTPGFVAETQFPDPFSLTYSPASGSVPELVGIAHVATAEQNNVNVGAVSVATVGKFRDRVAEEVGGSIVTNPVFTQSIPTGGSISGMAFAGDVLGLRNVFLTANLVSAPDVLLSVLTPVAVDSGVYYLTAQPQEVLFVGSQIGAIEMRSLVVDSTQTRAYASVRFFAPGDSFNAGVATIDLTGDSLKILSVVEFGDELQRPFLREVTLPDGNLQKLIYVGDIRRDKIYVVDVSTDDALVVKEIDGRTTRMIDGKAAQARLLDSPSHFVFATLGGTSLGFVTNFGNSTIAVLDVTDPDPRLHRIVARLGRNIDPEGEMEKPQ